MTKATISPVTGIISSTLDGVVMETPTFAQSYFGAAQLMMPGVRALAAGGIKCTPALALVCGHVLEGLLKAYLSKGGSNARLKAPDVNHNLNKLWQMAQGEGLALPTDRIEWRDVLHAIHGPPYNLRYSERIHGIQLPHSEPMVSQLEVILDTVRAGL